MAITQSREVAVLQKSVSFYFSILFPGSVQVFLQLNGIAACVHDSDVWAVCEGISLSLFPVASAGELQMARDCWNGLMWVRSLESLFSMDSSVIFHLMSSCGQLARVSSHHGDLSLAGLPRALNRQLPGKLTKFRLDIGTLPFLLHFAGQSRSQGPSPDSMWEGPPGGGEYCETGFNGELPWRLITT